MKCISTPIVRFVSLLLILCFSPPGAAEYIVKPGDTLTRIAREHLTSDLKYNSPEITQFINQVMDQNPLLFPKRNPHLISIGMKLNLPGRHPEPEIESTVESEINIPQKIIAQVIQLKGSGVLQHDDESQESIHVGQALKEGDSIYTSRDSQVVVEFVDQASLIVKASSQVEIEEYQWDDQSGAGNSVIDFIKGAFRAVSGLIGENQPQDYSVKTPVATIGIRGTDFGARYCANSTCKVETGENSVTLSQGIYIGVLDGQISSKSDGKETLVDAGKAIFQKDAASPAEPIKNLPGIIFSVAELKSYDPVPVTAKEPEKKVERPFYRAFWLTGHGNIVKDSEGQCIRTEEYRSDHHVVECE